MLGLRKKKKKKNGKSGAMSTKIKDKTRKTRISE